MSTIMNFILEGNLKQTALYTYSTIMKFILEGKLCFTETKRLCRITLLRAEAEHSCEEESDIYFKRLNFFRRIFDIVSIFWALFPRISSWLGNSLTMFESIRAEHWSRWGWLSSWSQPSLHLTLVWPCSLLHFTSIVLDLSAKAKLFSLIVILLVPDFR